MTIKIVLADDHPIVLDGLVQLFLREPGYEILGSATTGEDALRLVREFKPDIVVLDLRKAGGFTDFFVICTGGNPRQIAAIADSVADTLRTDFGERPHLTEGVEKSQLILLDYFNFVVHIFSRECRDFYELERLWGNAERHEFSAPA